VLSAKRIVRERKLEIMADYRGGHYDKGMLTEAAGQTLTEGRCR